MTITSEQINSLPLLLGIITDMGIRTLIDDHITPHGTWAGASVGTLVSLWLGHILQERDQRVVLVRNWAAERRRTIHQLLDITLRPTDCTADRLAHVVTMLGDPAVQAALDADLVQRWVRVSALPTDTIRLDSTSGSVYHHPADPASWLQLGPSKDHRPDLRQFKAMLAALDPLGMPLACPLIAGQRADDGWYLPADEAAVTALGTRAGLVVGDSQLAALGTRGHRVAQSSADRPPSATAEIAGWIAAALARAAPWQVIETVDPTTGEIVPDAVIDVWEREQTWIDPATQQGHAWTERVLLVRSAADQVGVRRRRAATLARLTDELRALWRPPARCRKRYRTRDDLERLVAARIAQAHLSGVVHAPGVEEALPDGTPRGRVDRISGVICHRKTGQVDVLESSYVLTASLKPPFIAGAASSAA